MMITFQSEKLVSEKLFPSAYIPTNTNTIEAPKKSRLMLWIIIGIVGVCAGLFSFFQSNLIGEVGQIAKVIR